MIIVSDKGQRVCHIRQGTLTRNGLRGGAVKSENSKNKSVDTNKYENEGEYPTIEYELIHS